FLALAPAIDSDGLGYHLLSPKRWLLSGRISYLPTHLFTNSPQGVESLFAIPMAIWSDSAAKLVHYSLGVLSIVAIYALGRRLAGSFTGAMAAGLFVLGLPFVRWTVALPLFTWAFIDLGVVLMLTCAVLAWFLWRDNHSFRWLCCCGLCAGFAVSFKLTALPVPLALCALTTWQIVR